MNRVRPMLAQSGLTLDSWHYAVLHSIEMMNRVPFKKLDNTSPLYFLMNKLDAAHTIKDIPPHSFGTLVVIRIHTQKSKGKLHPNGIEGIYLGITNTVLGGYTIWIPIKLKKCKNDNTLFCCGRIIHTKGVKFMNGMFMEWLEDNHNFVNNTNYESFMTESIDIPLSDSTNGNHETEKDITEHVEEHYYKQQENIKNSQPFKIIINNNNTTPTEAKIIAYCNSLRYKMILVSF